MNPSLDPITSFPVLDNCSFYVWIKKARFPSLIFLWLLLQFFVFSKTYHLHQSFCSPDHEDFSQGWATSYTFFTLHLHLPAIKKKRKAKQNNKKQTLCLFQGQESRRGAMSQFYYEISWGESSACLEATGAGSGGEAGRPVLGAFRRRGKKKHGMKGSWHSGVLQHEPTALGDIRHLLLSLLMLLFFLLF